MIGRVTVHGDGEKAPLYDGDDNPAEHLPDGTYLAEWLEYCRRGRQWAATGRVVISGAVCRFVTFIRARRR